jgi:hypothetical protein
MTSNPNSSDFSYKKYSLEQLDNWVNDAVNCEDLTPQDIYETILKCVNESVVYHKKYYTKSVELLSLLKGYRSFEIDTSLDDIDASPGVSSATQRDWNSFWEENYYPEEVKVDDGMRPWGHSDLEYMIANPTLTEDRISNFPGEQYTEEELNAMCDKAATENDKEKCREYNLREAEYYNKRAQLDAEYNMTKADGYSASEQ